MGSFTRLDFMLTLRQCILIRIYRYSMMIIRSNKKWAASTEMRSTRFYCFSCLKHPSSWQHHETSANKVSLFRFRKIVLIRCPSSAIFFGDLILPLCVAPRLCGETLKHLLLRLWCDFGCDFEFSILYQQSMWCSQKLAFLFLSTLMWSLSTTWSFCSQKLFFRNLEILRLLLNMFLACCP